METKYFRLHNLQDYQVPTVNLNEDYILKRLHDPKEISEIWLQIGGCTLLNYTFILFLNLKESTFETRQNAFYCTAKAL